MGLRKLAAQFTLGPDYFPPLILKAVMTDYILHQGDLPDSIEWMGPVAIDCEMLGLKVGRDRLCLVQLRDTGGKAHLVQFAEDSYKAPNLKKLLNNKKILKIFHFGQTDIAYLNYYLGAKTAPVFDTKIASKIARRFTDRHGLNDLCKEMLGIELSKEQQSSDWGAAQLSRDQLTYAARDVLHLHGLMEKLIEMLARDGLTDIADLAFENVINNGLIEARGLNTNALFAHSSSDRV